MRSMLEGQRSEVPKLVKGGVCDNSDSNQADAFAGEHQKHAGGKDKLKRPP